MPTGAVTYIKVSFNKDADPDNLDPREKLYTYATTEALQRGELGTVPDHRGGGPKRVKVVEVGIPQPAYACKECVRYVPPPAAKPEAESFERDGE